MCQVLELQALMDNLSEDVRADFLNGSNGAVVSFFKKNCPLILLCIHVTYSNFVKTVPLKNKLTILTQDLKLNPCISKVEQIVHVSRLEYRVSTNFHSEYSSLERV